MADGGRVNDETEAKAFAFARDKIDIYVLGYGSTQLGIGNLRTQAKKAVQDGTKGNLLSHASQSQTKSLIARKFFVLIEFLKFF